MGVWVTQLRKGITEIVVLAALQRGEAYGYELLQRINQIEGLALSESMVYPLLARLASDRLVKVRSAASPNGPPRRYYQLTAAGRRHLQQMWDDWKELSDAVQKLVTEHRDE